MPPHDPSWPLATLSLGCGLACGLGCSSIGTSATALTDPHAVSYVAYVPPAQAMAWDGRTATEGTLRAEGSAVGSSVHRNQTWGEGAGALRVPDMMLEGVLTLAVTSNFEIGARGTYAAYAWSEPNAKGAAPFPDRPTLWGLGLEMRGMIGLDRAKRFTIGIGGNALRYDLHFAEWHALDSPACPPGGTCFVDGTATPATSYELHGQQSNSQLVFNVAVYPSVGIGENNSLGHVFAGISAYSGFGDASSKSGPANGDAPKAASLIPIVGAGYGLKVSPMRFAVLVSTPLTSGRAGLDYGISGSFTFGLDFELWRPPEPGKERIR